MKSEKMQERRHQEIEYRTGIQRFYERYAHAEAQGFEWDYVTKLEGEDGHTRHDISRLLAREDQVSPTN